MICGVIFPLHNMLTQFNHIKQAYNDFRLSLLKDGKLPLRETSAGFWGPSICDELFMIFKKMRLECCNNFLDVGSGDGRVVLIASLFTKAQGIELDLLLYKKSLEIRDRLGLAADFLHDDFFLHDFRKYDILFCYPDKPLYYGLDQKFRDELHGKLIVYGPPPADIGLPQEESFRVNGTMVSVYHPSRT